MDFTKKVTTTERYEALVAPSNLETTHLNSESNVIIDTTSSVITSFFLPLLYNAFIYKLT